MATRVLFALNSDDPEIVAQGLEEFHRQIASDHHIELSYGYHGRGYSGQFLEVFRPQPVPSIVGALAAFIRASPQLEELFVLWGLPGRDDDKRLCASHMSCLAIILHCLAATQSTLCNAVVNRVLHEFSRSIVSQLTSGDLRLIHSTLGLILAMCRSSTQNCRDTVQKLLNTSPNTYATLLQQGKTITWDGPVAAGAAASAVSAAAAATSSTAAAATGSDGAEEAVATTAGVKLKTDARFLLILIVLTAVEAADYSIASELFSSGTSLLKRVTNAIHKDSTSTVKLVLECLMHFRRQSHIEQLLGSRILDPKFQNNLLMMYNCEDSQVQEVVHAFLSNHCSHLASSMGKGGPSGKKSAVQSNARNAAIQLLRALEGHRDLRHREVSTAAIRATAATVSTAATAATVGNVNTVSTVL
jgi:hypothetical protein